jgi:tetratricopeptide (TPR) repeat protein/thiol-disulfide isomerase/thioredoxin
MKPFTVTIYDLRFTSGLRFRRAVRRCPFLFLLLLPFASMADIVRVSGVVVGRDDQPVADAAINDWWVAEDSRMKGADAYTGRDGTFTLELELSPEGKPLLVYDERQETGGLILVTPAMAKAPLRIRLGPLVTVRGNYYCDELQEAPGWCNTIIEFTTNRFRIVECRSWDGTFSLKLPPGQYQLNGYDGTTVFGIQQALTLSAARPHHDLNRIELEATPTAKAWGKPSPPWHITEARGMPTNATIQSFRGKWLLLDFWGYWCGPCLEAMPELFDFYDRHSADRARFEIVAVHEGASSLKEMDEHLQGTVKGLWKGRTLPFPVLVDAGETTFTNFGIRSYPEQVLIDPEGQIVRDGHLFLLEQIFESREREPTPVAFSLDGKQVAFVRNRQMIEVRPVGGGKSRIFNVDGSRVTCLAFDPDGKDLAIGAADGSIRMWRVSSGRPVNRIGQHQGSVFSLAFSPDGRRLAAGAFDATRVWDAEIRGEFAQINGRQFPAWAVAFSPDGRKLAADGCSSIRVWDVQSGQMTASLSKRQPGLNRGLAFSPDGRTLASHGGASVLLWSTETGKLTATLAPMQSPLAYFQFSKDGKSVVTLTRGKSVQSWSVDGKLMDGRGLDLEKMAMRFAERLPEDGAALALEARSFVVKPAPTRAEVELALEQARRACQWQPRDPFARGILGVALYQAGLYRESLAAFDEAAAMRDSAGTFIPVLPDDEIFRAMALRKIGDTERMRAALIEIWTERIGEAGRSPPALQELHRMEFGPQPDLAQAYIMPRLRAGFSAGQVLENLQTSHPGVEWRTTAAKMMPLATAVCEVQRLQRKIGLRDRIIAAVKKSQSIAPEWRSAAAGLAAESTEDASHLNSLSWDTVVQPDRSPADYALALAQAETAYRLSPDEAIRNTLGVACYRVGQFDKAVRLLSESERTNADGIANPDDLPFLAMALQKAGKPDEAKKRFDQLLALLAKEEPDQADQKLVNEVKKVLEAR